MENVFPSILDKTIRTKSLWEKQIDTCYCFWYQRLQLQHSQRRMLWVKSISKTIFRTVLFNQKPILLRLIIFLSQCSTDGEETEANSIQYTYIVLLLNWNYRKYTSCCLEKSEINLCTQKRARSWLKFLVEWCSAFTI